MNWSQPRKTFKSSEKNANQRVSTTCLNTPPKHTQTRDQYQSSPEAKQCPYHFGQPTHICLTCRRSICLRCAITYCQQHTIHPEEQILQLLVVDLQKLTIQPKIQDIQLRLKQSQQRQQFVMKKIAKMLNEIEQNFQYLKNMVQKKKEQIIHYFRTQLQEKFIRQYQYFKQLLSQKLNWLQQYNNPDFPPKCMSIQQLDKLAQKIKKQVPNSEAMSKAQLKISKLIAGKQKIKINNIWSEQKLEQVLFQIQNIQYKIKESNLNNSLLNSNKKKRVTTQVSDSHKIDRFDKPDRVLQFNSSSKNPFAGIMLKSGSNSRFPTGRKADL